MSAGARVAIRLTVTPILVAALVGLLYFEHQQIRQDPQKMLILPLLITAVAGGALLEIFRMVRIKGLHPAWAAGCCYFLLKMTAVILAISYGGMPRIPGWVSIAITVGAFADVIFLLYLLTKLVFCRSGFSIEDAGISFLAPMYVLLLKTIVDLYNLIPVQPLGLGGQTISPDQLDQVAEQLRQHAIQSRADGFMLLLVFVFAASKVPDMLGYIVGKTIGKHPMAPVLSPKKTWEGGIAGFMGGVIASAALLLLTPLRAALGLPPLLLIALSVAVTISAIVGDLVKSAVKRWAGVKDSGLIPEFGGILDIIDSFLLSAPTTYLFLSLAPKLI